MYTTLLQDPRSDLPCHAAQSLPRRRHSLRHTDPNKTIVIVGTRCKDDRNAEFTLKNLEHPWKAWTFRMQSGSLRRHRLHNEQPYDFAGSRNSTLGRGDTHRARRDRLCFLISVIISLVGHNGSITSYSAVLPEPAHSNSTPPACTCTVLKI